MIDSVPTKLGHTNLYEGRGEIWYRTLTEKTGGSIAGVHATVDKAGNVTSRMTLTRMAFTGPPALALKKNKDHRELYLVVEGPDFAFADRLDPKDGAKARKFAAKINTSAAGRRNSKGG
jgi:hypothetical protein